MRKRSVGINVRVSVTEKRKMTLMAKRCGLSLSEYLRQRALGYEPGGHPPKEVFDMCPSTFTYRFKLILKANNLPLDLSVHSLRHTNASLLIAQGVDVRTVASLLGHAQASTTLDIYAHAFDKNKRKAQEKLGKAIGL